MSGLTLTEGVIGDVAVLSVAGSVDVYTSPELRESLIRADMRGHARILLDLTACTFLDSTGLAMIVGALKRARARSQHGEVMLAGTPEHLFKVFLITGLAKMFAVYGSRDEAVTALAGERADG